MPWLKIIYLNLIIDPIVVIIELYFFNKLGGLR